MPAAIPLIAGAFLAAGTVATAVGVTLGVAFTIGAVAVSWGAVLAITGLALMAVSYLAAKKPKVESAAQQLDLKLDPQAPIPICFGRTATGGYAVERLTWDRKNAFLGIVAVLSAGGPIQGIEAYRAGDYNIGFYNSPYEMMTAALTTNGQSTKLYKNKMSQRWMSGETPAPQTTAQASGRPFRSGKLSGLAHAITAYNYDTDAFPQGVPSSLWVLKGVKLYDPRKDSTYPGGSGSHRINVPATYEYSENPYLAALQWTLGRYANGQRIYGIGAKPSEVDIASFVAGANVADANNWKIGGVVTTNDDKFAVLTSILAAGGGLPVARGAQIAVTYNAPKATVAVLTEADVIGEVEISSTTSWRDRQNTIIPKYREESQIWEIISGERVSAAQYVIEDGGETKTVEVEFPLVQQARQAHQLAAYELCNTREFLTLTANCSLRMLGVRVGEGIMIQLPQLAASSVKCIVVAREFDPMSSSVTLSLKSETDAKHAFALGQSQVAPPSPRLDTYDPSNPGAPETNAWAITDTEISNATQRVPTLVVSGAADDPNTATIIFEYRPTGSPTWLNWGEFSRLTTRAEINSVTSGTSYQVAVSYRTTLGVIGERLILSATAGALKLDYDASLVGVPGSLGDVNEQEGIKLGGIAPGADVTGANTALNTVNVGTVPAATLVADTAAVKAAVTNGGAIVPISSIIAKQTDLTNLFGTTASASASATAAANSQSAADLAKVAAQAARDIATTQAGLADTARIAAQTAKSNTDTALTASQSARDAAQAAQALAITKAGEASTSASNASGFATTASGKADIAIQKAGDAGTFASNASASANTASTKAGEASTSASNAATSETNATGSKNAAAISAGVSATSRDTAISVAATLYPERPLPDSTFFGFGSGGSGDIRTGPVAQPSRIVLRNGQYVMTQIGGDWAQIDKVIPATPGRIYEVEVEAEYVNITPDLVMTAGVSVARADYSMVGGGTQGNSPAYGGSGTRVYKTRVSEVTDMTVTPPVYSWNAGDGTVPTYLRFRGRVNKPTGVTGDVYINRVTVRDVTSQIAAERQASAAAGSASAASSSASTASTKAGEALSSASAANTSRTDAQTAAGNAQTYASNASTSEQNALGSKNAAATSQGVAASSATAAQTVAYATLPDRLSQREYFASTSASSGSPATATAFTAGSIVTVAGEGSVIEFPANTDNGAINRGVMPITQGRTYEARVRIQFTSVKNSRRFIYLFILDANYNGLAAIPANIPQYDSTTNFVVHSFRASAAAILSAYPSAAYVRAAFNVVDQPPVWRASSLQLVDVTAETAVQGVVNNLVPDRPANKADFYTGYSQNGRPDAIPVNTLAGTVGTDTVEGDFYTVAVSGAHVITRGWVPIGTGRTLTLTVRVRTPAAAGNVYPQLMLYAADGAFLRDVSSYYVATPSNAWTTFTYSFTSAQLLYLQANAVYARGSIDPRPASGAFQISTLRLRDTTDVDAAAGSASAAAGSASTASTKASDAGIAAGAATTAKTDAQTAAGQALSYRNDASTSAQTATDKSNIATTQAGVSATSATAASLSAKATVPSNFTDPTNWVAWNGWGGSVTFANGLANIKTGGSFYSAFTMPLADAQVYRITARHRTINQGGGVTYIGTTANGGNAYSWRVNNKPTVAVGVWETTTFEVTTADILAQSSTATSFGVGFLTGYSYTSDAEVSMLSIENVTSEKASAGSASAAAGSASTASTKASDAGVAAGAATTAKTDAQTAAGQALTYRNDASTSASNAQGFSNTASTQAGVATTQAGNAAGSASAAAGSASTAGTKAGDAGNSAIAANQAKLDAQAANGTAQSAATQANDAKVLANSAAAASQSSAVLSANVSLNAINANPVFANYPGALTGDLPNNWTFGATNIGAGYRVAGANGLGYAYRLPAPANTDSYTAFVTALGSISTNQWYVVEATIVLNSGSLVGSGMLFRPTDINGNNTDYTLPFATTPDPVTGAVAGAGVVGQTYRFSKLFKVTAPAAASYCSLYLMSHWTVLGSTASAVDITWQRAQVRAATTQEIQAQSAFDSATTLSSSVSQQAGALASLSGRSTAYLQSTVNAGSSAQAFVTIQADSNVPSAAPLTFLGDVSSLTISGRNLTKIAGGNGAWDRSVYSKESYTGTAYISAQQATVSGSFVMFGLNTDPTTDSNYTSIDHAIYLNNAVGSIYENGAQQSVTFTVAPTDVFSVEYAGTTVTYKKNTTVLFLTTVAANRVYYADTSFYQYGAGLKNLVFASAGPINNSTIALGASEVHIYTGTEGGYKKTLSISNGNAVFSGALQAGTSIRLGTGAGWPVALAQRDFTISDGTVVAFGVDLGNAPKLTFAGNGLVALNSGETYNLYAENLTSTGFTARLKIITPSAPASFDLTIATTPGTGPAYQIDKGANADSTTGNYNLVFNGNVTMSATSYEPDQ